MSAALPLGVFWSCPFCSWVELCLSCPGISLFALLCSLLSAQPAQQSSLPVHRGLRPAVFWDDRIHLFLPLETLVSCHSLTVNIQKHNLCGLLINMCTITAFLFFKAEFLELFQVLVNHFSSDLYKVLGLFTCLTVGFISLSLDCFCFVTFKMPN